MKSLASHHRLSLTLFFCCICFLISSCGPAVAAPSPTATSTLTLTPTTAPSFTPKPTLTPTPTKTQVPVLCGGPPAMFILLVGSDARQDGYAIGLADSIRVVRVDFIEARIQVLAFPRDLYVEIPEIEDHHDITHGKLNQAYLYGNPGYNYYDGMGQGPGLLALTLEQNFGVQMDHYVAVNLQTFVRIVDELGGIDVDLPYEIDGRVKGSRDQNRVFAAGEQHLNGYRTMLLGRMRSEGDFSRIELQDLILQAFAEKLLSPAAILKLPGWIETFSESVQTDLGPAEVAQLLCLRTRLDTQNVEFGNFPHNLFENGRVQDPVLGNTSILKVDFDVLRAYVQSFNNGNWPRGQQSPREMIVP